MVVKTNKTLPTTAKAKAKTRAQEKAEKVVDVDTSTSLNDEQSDEEEIIIKKKPAIATTKKNNAKDQKKDKKDNIILEVKTTQTGAFKQVIERISNFISDCCIVFIPPDETIKDDDYYEEVEETIPKKPLKKKGVEVSEEEDSSNSKSPTKKKKSPIKKKTLKNAQKANTESSEEKEINVKKVKASVNAKKTASEAAKQPTKKNTGGIRILRLTEDKSILIKLNLDAINFEYFRCDEPKITIGVDMHNLHAHLKMVNDDDPIILYMKRDNRSAMYIRSLNGNNESSEETDMEIYLMEIGNPEMPIPQTEFQNKITMASDKFHNICKKLNNNSTHVEITSINNEILFRGQNEGGKVTMTYKDINYSSKKKDKQDQVVQGVYELRNLMGFSKCNKLCHTIEIYLKNDFPLVLVISVATLGKMYVFLSPIENGAN